MVLTACKVNVFFPRLCSPGEHINVHEHFRTFVDKILLQALSVVCPVQSQNFGLSMAADFRRFRSENGQVFAKGASMPSRYCTQLLDVMHNMIDAGGNEFLLLQGFFFDTWSAGIKQPLHSRRLEDCLTDIDWSLVDYSNAFVDIACERVPSAAVVGIPCKDSLPTMIQAVFGERHTQRCKSRYV